MTLSEIFYWLKKVLEKVCPPASKQKILF